MAGGAIEVVEVAAAQQGQADGLEIAGRGDNERDGRAVGSVEDGSVLDLDVGVGGAKAGRVGDEGGVRDAGDGLEAGEKPIVEVLASVGVLVSLVGEINARDHELAGGNGAVGFEGLDETVHKDAGAGEQHEGERELEDDEGGGEEASAMTADGARAFLQDLVEVGARGAESGGDAKGQTAEDAERGEVAEDGVVHGELHPVGFADVGGGEIEPADAEYAESEDRGRRRER